LASGGLWAEMGTNAARVETNSAMMRGKRFVISVLPEL
jgi:hypothetical protein